MTETRWVSPGSTHPTTLAGRGPSTYDPVGAVPILVGAAKEAGEMARMATTTGSSRAIGLVVGLSAGVLLMPAAASANVSHATGTVNGVACDVWTWTDSNSKTRTVALKMEGHGNPGHGGYAVQMTYYRFYYTALMPAGIWQKITVNAANESDGGFGYFVSHERYRYFANGAVATIAGQIFNKDDSPLGSGFAATSSIPLNTAAAGAESFVISYGHYGTKTPWQINASNGEDSPLLPTTASSYAFYAMPVTTIWVFQSGRDYPRIDISVDLSKVIPTGMTTPAAGLISFDVRGPYGVMVFDNGANGTVDTAVWGDETNLFTTTVTPVTRSSTWTWKAANPGARYNALVTGTLGQLSGRFEMGLFEPHPASGSALTDGYAAERSYTNATYAATGGVSEDACSPQAQQTLPSDGNWPYQSVQYSLPCPPTANFLTTPTAGKKIAWGSTSYYGSTLTSTWNGYESLPLNAFPASHKINYSVTAVRSISE
jgi:hypothetical protein